MKSVFNNRKKRSKEEIVASIIVTSRQGASKTGIMYSSYLSFSQLNKYIELAMKTNVIYLNGDGKYFATSKGLEFLKCFEEVHSIENNALEKRKMLVQILGEDPPSC